MVEQKGQASAEAQNNPHLEAPYVTIVRDVIHKHGKDSKGRRMLLGHQHSLDTVLNDINEQIIGDGLFDWKSKEQKGVGFWAGHLSVKPELIAKIAGIQLGEPNVPKQPQAEPEEQPKVESQEKDEKQRPEHYVYFVEPSFGIPPDGNLFSALDMSIARFVNEMPKVAAAIRRGERPPSVDIFVLGGPNAFAATVTKDFVDSVKKDGFDAYGKLYAEFVEDNLPTNKDTLNKTRVVIQGASKGALTSDATFHHLSEKIQSRTQLLYDNPGGNQGRNLPTQLGRSINLGAGMGLEVGVRAFVGAVKDSAFSTQKKFYADIAKARGILEDSEEQKKLKGDLFLRVSQFLPVVGMPFKGGGEIRMLSHGTPLDKRLRSYTRISTPDPVNSNFRNLARVNALRGIDGLANVIRRGLRLEPSPRRGLVAKQHGKRLTFATSNIAHNFPWVKGIENGSWDRKIRFIEDTRPPEKTSEQPAA